MNEIKKLYAIPASYPPHKIIIEDQCFEKCGSLVLGMINDDQVGPCFTCSRTDCPYEHEDSKISVGGTSDGAPVYLRRLGKKELTV